MTGRMTSVWVPGSGHAGFADYGRVAPDRMIESLREMARHERDAAQHILDASDDQFVVDTYTGIHVQRDRKRLWPPSPADSTQEEK